MNSNYTYSIKVNEALATYGAKTHGPLNRRVERLKRFTDLKNKHYQDEIKVEHARMIANQEREYRMNNRVREIYNKEFLGAIDRKYGLVEEQQDVELPMYSTPPRSTRSTVSPSARKISRRLWNHDYNLRPREENGLDLLSRAIQNGFVITDRG